MKKNNIHVSDLIFYKDKYEDIIKFLEENKIENLEFFIEPLDEEYTEKMLKILNNIKLENISFHGPFRKCNLALINKKSWEDVRFSYEESFKIGKKYNPKYFVLHTNEKVINDIPKIEYIKKISEKIEKINNMAKKYKVNLVIENVGIQQNMLFNQKDFEKLILENNYKCLIDIGHAFVNKWDIETLIKNLKNNILGYHFHNNNGIYDEHKPIDEGKIDYDKIMKIIKKYTKDATIVLEYDYSIEKEKVKKDYIKLK